MARVKSKITEKLTLKRKPGRPKGSKTKKATEQEEPVVTLEVLEEKVEKAEKKAVKKPRAKKVEAPVEPEFAQLIIRLETGVKEAYRQACDENMRTMSQQTTYLIHSFLRAEKRRKKEEGS